MLFCSSMRCGEKKLQFKFSSQKQKVALPALALGKRVKATFFFLFCSSRCYDVRNTVNLSSELQLKGIRIALTAHISRVQLKRRREYAHLGVINGKKHFSDARIRGFNMKTSFIPLYFVQTVHYLGEYSTSTFPFLPSVQFTAICLPRTPRLYFFY